MFPYPDGTKIRYNKNIDRPDIRPGFERILRNIKTILDEAGKVDERFGLRAEPALGNEVSSSKGLDLFKISLDKWKSRIRKHQKQTTVWHVTRWAIHDAKKFESMINRLKDFVDSLESITESLGLLAEQRRLLREEVQSISDVASLRLLRDVSSSHHSSQHDISDIASQRMVSITESIAEQRSLISTTLPTTSASFVTAYTGSMATSGLPIPGAWPPSLQSSMRPEAGVETFASCLESSEGHYKCNRDKSTCGTCARCLHKGKACTSEQVPQNQRLLSQLIKQAGPRRPLCFEHGDANYGNALAKIKTENEQYWLQNSGNIIGHAHSGSSAAKRMFLEMRNIRAAKVPFVTVVPLADNLDRILASIEGTPETPYEGGVFWITVKLSETDPFGPPLMKFQTKIYHPNISPQDISVLITKRNGHRFYQQVYGRRIPEILQVCGIMESLQR